MRVTTFPPSSQSVYFEHDQKLSTKCLRNFKPQRKDIILNALKLDSVGKETAWLIVLTQTKILSQIKFRQILALAVPISSELALVISV